MRAALETGRLSYADLPGWQDDDLGAALEAFRPNSSRTHGDARRFFETRYRPGVPLDGHFTGYFEPELHGSLHACPDFPVPLHRMQDGQPYPERAGIDAFLAGQEIVWLRDEVDRFFLQVQGSGRVRLAQGGTMRVGYAGTNGHPYRSIGKLLVERGVFADDMTADALGDWLRFDPARGRAMMNENPSYVMFRKIALPEDSGPMGTLCAVAPGRSLAVDPAHLPLGTPVWIEVEGFARLCIAQDTGSAIKGPGRADLFFGTGEAAGLAAGRLNHRGRFVPLVPR